VIHLWLWKLWATVWLLMFCWGAVIVLFFCSRPVYGAGEAGVVRVVVGPGSGSGTVIWTGPGKTLILSCAHMFTDRNGRPQRDQKITIDAPSPNPGAIVRPGITLIAIDYERDLSLIQINTGPLPYVTPIAPAGHRTDPSKVLSVGYDGDKTIGRDGSTKGVVAVPARILESQGMRTWTAEAPREGRSGGPLLDANVGVVIGVVVGYEVERDRPGRGIYVSHASILKFLGQEGQAAQPVAQRPPTVQEWRDPWPRRPPTVQEYVTPMRGPVIVGAPPCPT
jgi:hypothetical protein